MDQQKPITERINWLWFFAFSDSFAFFIFICCDHFVFLLSFRLYTEVFSLEKVCMYSSILFQIAPVGHRRDLVKDKINSIAFLCIWTGFLLIYRKRCDLNPGWVFYCG